MIGLSRLTGQRIDGDAHLRQSLHDLMTTPIGTRVMRRDYGSLLPYLIDQPASPRLLMQLRAAILHAILRWEPRVRPVAIRLSIDAQGRAVLSLTHQTRTGPAQLQVTT